MTWQPEDQESKWFKTSEELDRMRWLLDEARMRMDMERDYGPMSPSEGENNWPDWARRFARRMEWQ